MGSSETLGNSQEKSLSDAEQYAVDMSRRMYEEMKQSQPDASEADVHKTIVSILGYYLGTPGYRLEDVVSQMLNQPKNNEQSLKNYIGWLLVEKNRQNAGQV